ncbi:hypothetical protein ACHAWF_012436 [Thalassiosira exigua]
MRRGDARRVPALRSSDDPSPSQSAASSSEPSDALHRIIAIVGKTASTAVSASFFLLLAYRRDASILALWIGSILNAVLGKVAKKLLNHDRPAELRDTDRIRLKPSDGGMPSSHAMSLGFVGTVVAGGIVPEEHRLAAELAMAAYSAAALRYRVRDHLHTVEQVAVGLALGVGNALAWLEFAVGRGGEAGPVLSWVRDHCVAADTGLFPYSTLAIPLVVGIVVVGSFERRIALWVKSGGKDD